MNTIPDSKLVIRLNSAAHLIIYTILLFRHSHSGNIRMAVLAGQSKNNQEAKGGKAGKHPERHVHMPTSKA
jgi:hypothetical protein